MGVVSNTIKKTWTLFHEDCLHDDEEILSHNKVTGWSLNFPIAGTCMPTKVCERTCYFAKGATSWPDSLRKQIRTFNSVKRSPFATAMKIRKEARSLGLTFVRWNGGGDLFEESVNCLNTCAALAPEIQFWVVTRKLDLAAKVAKRDNVFVHISIDAASMDKIEKYAKMDKLSDNYFFSYQGTPTEKINVAELSEKIQVIFFDKYDPKGAFTSAETICALNRNEDITASCDNCRRCFDGSAVSYRKKTSEQHS